MEYLFYYMPPTTNKSGKIKNNRTQQISIKTQVFFVKIELRHIWLQLLINHFILFSLTFSLKSLTHEKTNKVRIFITWNWQFIRDWRESKQENMIHIHDVTIMTSPGCNNFQLCKLGKITRNYYTAVRCYYVICSCYRTLPSAIWEIFCEFLIFCDLYHEPLGEWNKSKIWETTKIFANIARGNVR